MARTLTALAFLASACGPAPAAVVVQTVAPTTSMSTTSSTTSSTTTTHVHRKSAVLRTPPAKSADLGTQSGSIPAAIRAAFGSAGDKAVAVARCESSLIPTKQNGVHAGLFQLSRTWHEGRARRLGFAWAQMYEAGPNIAVAHHLFLEKGWAPWSCA